MGLWISLLRRLWEKRVSNLMYYNFDAPWRWKKTYWIFAKIADTCGDKLQRVGTQMPRYCKEQEILTPYLMNEIYMVFTDHAALRWLFTIQEPIEGLLRWRMRPVEFNFENCYKEWKRTCKQIISPISGSELNQLKMTPTKSLPSF